MDIYHEDTLQEPQQRTFEQILAEKYGGNISASLRDLLGEEINNPSVSRFLKGEIASIFLRSTLIRISHALGDEMDIIFPPSLYLQKLFLSIVDTPGWKRLSEDHDLVYWKNEQVFYGRTFYSFCKDIKGLSPKEANILYNALVGNIDSSFESMTLYLEKLSGKLGYTFEELFPPDVYRYKRLQELRSIPQLRSEVLLSDIRIDQNVALDERGPDADLLQAESEQGNEKCMQHILLNMMNLSPRSRQVLKGLYLESKTLKILGEELSISAERVRQIGDRAFRDMQKLCKVDLAGNEK